MDIEKFMPGTAGTIGTPWLKLTGAVCGALAVVLGLAVLAGWGVHSPFLVRIVPNLASMTPDAAASFVLGGLAILGLVTSLARFGLACATLSGVMASVALVEYAFHTSVFPAGRMSPTAAVCFVLVSAGLVFSDRGPSSKRGAVTGLAGLLVAAVGATCFIGALSGTGNAFAWGGFAPVAAHGAAGLFLLGMGATTLALHMSRASVREPIWVPVGAGLCIATIRVGLWQALSVRSHTAGDFLSNFTLLGGFASAVLFGVTVHLVLKANMQRAALQIANRRLEEEIAVRRRAEEAAQAANQAKSDFLANMSHEIRTPMTGVLGMIDLVRSGGLALQQREYLDMARSSADSLLSLINDILDLSKIEAGKLELAPVVFSVRQCVTEALRLFGGLTHNKGLELKVQVDSNVPDVLVGDPLRLRQVLVNLVGNAVKFTEFGYISTRVGIEGQSAERAALLVQITDTGVGIPEEKQKTIFEPFHQADGSIARRYGGTGLGLTISARLVELMGGRITLKSQLGKGSTFSFTVQLAQASTEAKAQFARAARVTALTPGRVITRKRHLRILLAEDNAVNQKLVFELLRKEGHNIEVVGNGREAVSAILRSTFDLVLMDVQMPLMDGLEATAAVRRTEKSGGPHTPIVAMTAHAMKGDEEKCIQAGMDDYLSKPIEFERLRAVLDKWTTKEYSQRFEVGPQNSYTTPA